jgi:Peptidase family M23
LSAPARKPSAQASLLALFILASLAASLCAAAPAQAQARVVQTRHDCGNGISLRLSAASATQGSLLRIEVRSAKPLAEAKLDWMNHSLPLWSEAATPGTQHALLGIDLETPIGPHDVTLNAQLPGGEPLSCSASVSVRDGKFPVEKLQVAQEFVEPSPAEAERAEKEGQRLREIFASVTPDRLWTGAFRMPLTGTHTARNFGRRRILNGQPRSPHTGVDIPAPSGTPIHSSQRGRVVLAENLFFAGNTVVVDHGLGVYTFYGHLSSIAVKEGDSVERGTLLGKVGATGRVTGPHLHWGLTVAQSRVNPLQIVGVPLGQIPPLAKKE